MTKTIIVIALFVACVSLSSCMFPTSTTTVSGVVLYNGKPIDGAEVKFGGKLGEVAAVTGTDGKFTLTARHRLTQMLEVRASKPGLGQSEKIKFPGFAAPDEEIKVRMITIFERSR